ncbi:MAG: hypothetical protein SFV55_08710 [Haliscomenobacter sp.]|uniref:hypothetical protein n=1 Tax=Haliscomenobacter sp. TaxID=2717303 RepID=UPI0029A2ACFC|nr:hypothetical protein [Haliscomenobacter sp.]MDX2068493.1 hypothetical protein [Haliscomenobacter sp.]
MKNHIILEPAAGKLFQMDEQGQVQIFDLDAGLQISLQGDLLNLALPTPFTPESVVRTTTLDPGQSHFNVVFDANAQLLSIVLTPFFPNSGASAVAGGGKMKLGSVDLTLSRNILATTTANLGVSEEAGQGPEARASQLEWLLLDLNQFSLVIELVDGQLRLSTIAVSQGNLA